MNYTTVQSLATQHGLSIYGGFHGDSSDGLPDSHQTLLMLGPSPQFWAHLQTQPEYMDSAPDPIDRWSKRTFDTLAKDLNATPFLPFGGPPYAPFLTWAIKTNRAWSSPVGMLVHDKTGLMVSFRGALAFREKLDLPETGRIPCTTCAQPCLSACPVDALSAENGYNTAACHTYLNTSAGQDCLAKGCIARRACPVSAGAHRTADQSAHHMAYFHPKGRTP